MNTNNSTFNIGEQIKHYRKLRNMSQEMLALSANTTPAFIGQIERGIKNPTIKTIEKIASALDMESHELLIPINNSPITENAKSRDKEIEKLLFSLNGLTDEDLKRYVTVFVEIINLRK